MTKRFLPFLVLTVLTCLSISGFAQIRYFDDVFPAVTRVNSIMYDSNRTINLIPPNSPPIVTAPLMCDMYEPTGDTAAKRPVIILLHTGSYLPAIANKQTTGNNKDSNVVETAMRFAKKGYLVFAMNYRLGWNPTTTNQAEATEQLLKATYRGIQDARNCVRFVRSNASVYKADTSKIILGGFGTGSYIAYGVATVDKRSEIESNLKFQRGDFTPMVSVDTLGDWLGRGEIPFFKYSVESNVSSNIHMIFSCGGAMGDLNWLEAGGVPIVGLHSVNDPFAPYTTGNVVVPTTGITVVPSASGARDVVVKANTVGVNNKINSRAYHDAFSVKAATLSTNNNLYPFYTATPESAPWEWWNRTIMQSINLPSAGAGRIADSLSMLTNPSMSASKAKAYIDTIVGFVTPRIVVQFDLAQLYSSVEEVDMNKYLSVFPNPASSVVNIQFTGAGNITSVRVIDIAGRTLINAQSVNNNKYAVDATQLAKGVYFIDASLSNGSTARQRFVVQ